MCSLKNVDVIILKSALDLKNNTMDWVLWLEFKKYYIMSPPNNSLK